MPLIKSKSSKAFGSNLETELRANRPKNQALAIAYATRRHAMRKAHGGLIKKTSNEKLDPMADTNESSLMEKMMAEAKNRYSQGGMVEPQDEDDSETTTTTHMDPKDYENFLTADMDSANEQFPDTEHFLSNEDAPDLHEDEEDPTTKSSVMAKILARVRARNMTK